ncbi:TPA: hypothetical protein L4S08_000561 [Pseudomonas aeruginosa]|uniref:hypothetical protein n=1 Tax=Pseudomonas TaxID=286 RepID=UPI000D20AF5F|nr:MULTISPECIES: hypothetical protein [Pseudomonas]AVZ17461.1 hypothetical protein DBA97_03780 [Pseudomonas aeruginosa]MCM8589370.1 hypothetical protein [Pseudomonas aeruginosa]MCM8673281.1 hypothetical protein [Pseudomonas aeruginosa]MCP2653228.1 hypothetical protein [Pseudomonas aeruginosa]MCT5442759.1 hypothetical protein [Pseudomonas aeruginosa]
MHLAIHPDRRHPPRNQFVKSILGEDLVDDAIAVFRLLLDIEFKRLLTGMIKAFRADKYLMQARADATAGRMYFMRKPHLFRCAAN